jgi:hypothetical protein
LNRYPTVAKRETSLPFQARSNTVWQSVIHHVAMIVSLCQATITMLGVIGKSVLDAMTKQLAVIASEKKIPDLKKIRISKMVRN